MHKRILFELKKKAVKMIEPGISDKRRELRWEKIRDSVVLKHR